MRRVHIYARLLKNGYAFDIILHIVNIGELAYEKSGKTEAFI